MGVYFLLQRVSVPTDSGILGIPAGTRVTKVGENEGKFKVSTGKLVFDIDLLQLTNDLDIAAAAAQQEINAKSALNRNIQERLAAQQKAAQERHKALMKAEQEKNRPLTVQEQQQMLYLREQQLRLQQRLQEMQPKPTPGPFDDSRRGKWVGGVDPYPTAAPPRYY